MINIFIIDDHPLFIEGVSAALRKETEKFNIVGTATSADEAMEKLQNLDVDVVLLDLLMPVVNGVKCCGLIKKKYPGTKVIALTGELDTILLYEVWMNDADAIILKYSGKEELYNTIHTVIDGERQVGKGVPFFLKPEYEDRQKNLPHLTNREEQVLTKLAQGLSRKQTSDALFISTASVNFHCKNIYKKFGKHHLNEVIEEARRLRMLP